MARPRIFVSSTFYDLKHIRSSMELFIESLGFEPVLSEKGDIAYNPDIALDESCYREAAAADIFVLIVGGRYGSEASSGDPGAKRVFFDQYESITRKEFEAAYEADIPVFVLVESAVYAEYRTYLKNKGNKSVKYAHVDSVNVFGLIEDILARHRNNPIFQFDRSAQIEGWLRDQWAGLFRELLRSRSQQRQLLALTSQVGELKAVNETLKTYLEKVLGKITPETAGDVIKGEEIRLRDAKKLEAIRANRWFRHLQELHKFSDEQAERAIVEPTTADEMYHLLDTIAEVNGTDSPSGMLRIIPSPKKDANEARSIAGVEPIDFGHEWGHELPNADDGPVSPPAKRKTRPKKL